MVRGASPAALYIVWQVSAIASLANVSMAASQASLGNTVMTRVASAVLHDADRMARVWASAL